MAGGVVGLGGGGGGGDGFAVVVFALAFFGVFVVAASSVARLVNLFLDVFTKKFY